MEVNQHLLEKYWSGKCTTEERKAVEQWMTADVPEVAYELRNATDEEQTKEKLWQRILEQQESNEQDVRETRNLFQPARVQRTMVAALLLLLMAGGVYVFQSAGLNLFGEKAHALKELKVPYGKKMKLALPDGSQVYLNAGTTFRYPSKFSKKERKVYLEGEAFFMVAKEAEHPFLVQTKRTTTKVLGTKFNLTSRENDADVLTVAEGSVQFTAPGQSDTLILGVNTQGRFNGTEMLKLKVDSHRKTAWTQGGLVFDNLPLPEVAAELERCFDVKINWDDPQLAAYRVKANFENASLSAVLQDVAFSLHIHYKIKDKEVTLYR
ncbi:FecR family protein [Olivibacter sp. XZL3]|uniref:FecR family protein n=1 Tax=Olivibacter sp. XZL3 TaxID=1735116 RepID=UPI0010659DA6|nr:FecR domain-containing protein [Olivibacter sp. XZL3]